MLGYIKGYVMNMIDPSGRLIVNVQDVGYEIFTPVRKDQPIEQGQEVELWIYTHVREDSFCLYGFKEEEEKAVFLSLISINGVGPKSAIGILSAAPYESLKEKIEAEDVDFLMKLPKIGKKTAQQMILSLKGKWPEFQTQIADSSTQGVRNEISSALLRLGFRSSEIKVVIDKVDAQKGVKEGIKYALSILQNL